jgi:hypothetical protein
MDRHLTTRQTELYWNEGTITYENISQSTLLRFHRYGASVGQAGGGNRQFSR